ncbi:MAG: NAD(P)H-hydrate dehydratase [Chloroflexota bacterium]|nr:NAD(P)H-hydrate dehydratase [Chloroflexota bacterium]
MTEPASWQRPTLGANERTIDHAAAFAALPRRSPGAHKWGVGGLVVVAGSPGYAGAAILTTMAASRAGAGIVMTAISRSLSLALNIHVPEAVIIPLPDGDSSASGRRAAELIEAKLEKAAAIVVGPGLGEDTAAGLLLAALFGTRTVRDEIGFGTSAANVSSNGEDAGLLAASAKPVVIDADGLNWLGQQGEWWQRLAPGQAVLTPHAGELERLSGLPVDVIAADPAAAARDAASRWRQIVVLKCGHTIVTDGTVTLVAEDAPPSLATAGTGDVLAGTIGAFLAQGVEPLAAAALAVYAGARAARRVEERTGTLGLVASDLPLAIAAELAGLERGKENDRD